MPMDMSLERADEVVRNLWRQDVRAWDRYWVPVFRRFAHDLVLDANASPGQILLDIGTGTGVATFEAAKRCTPDGFVFGVDRLQPMIALAKVKSARTRFRNVRFLQMDARRLIFPDGMFDAVVSNCGFSLVRFYQAVAEVFRVLRKGGVFVFDEWRYADVGPHRVFSEVLQQYRTSTPSGTLKLQRDSLALLERFNNRELRLQTEMRELRRAGFRNVEATPRNYRINLPSVDAYLKMRLKRATLKRELRELSPAGRRAMLHAFRTGLRRFVRGSRFSFDWKVTFVRAKR